MACELWSMACELRSMACELRPMACESRSMACLPSPHRCRLAIRVGSSVDDDNNKPVWPTWTLGALFIRARCIHINRICFHIPVIEESGPPCSGQEAPCSMSTNSSRFPDR
jgi:hypothetical protein